MAIDDSCLDRIFRNARTYRAWIDRPVADETLRALYELMKWGPTTSNSSPARLVFVKSAQAKALLKPTLAPENVPHTMAAPVTVIVGFDLEFYERLPFLSPHNDARSWFVGKPYEHIHTTALRNGSLQGGYLIIAARALGLDCGPMSGFDGARVDASFFPGGKVRSNFLCNLGYGDPAKLRPRAPRLAFEDACAIV